ncbi:MAG: M14 family zinc carboxypeptidase, partial [Planctomycetota bacterium]
AAITSPANHARLEELRRNHVKKVRSGAETEDGPLFVWMGYGVHGNEASAMNTSPLLGYHLAAAEGAEIDAFLERTVVLVDPVLNPDGAGRFAHWANMHRAKNPNGHRANRDHDEAWPGGRTNHYWFDLNRDWLLMTHPESQGRVPEFQRWLPTVLTDYHEMGGDSTYFFQPGIPSRRNPFTPSENHALTRKIALFHAKSLDQLGRLYFTEERFDDFYYGKGSTYPDVHGSIGILFEQASARGQIYDGDSGRVSFPMAIQNQFVTSLSTLRAADEMRDELTGYQRRFYRDALAESGALGFETWRFSSDDDPHRAFELARRLVAHGIEVYRADAARTAEAAPRTDFFVPTRQAQVRLARSLFEHRTSWDDNSFYDVSAWTFQDSFGVELEETDEPAGGVMLTARDFDGPTRATEAERDRPSDMWASTLLSAGAMAWTLPWDSETVPQAIAKLQRRGVTVRVASKPLDADPLSTEEAQAAESRARGADREPTRRTGLTNDSDRLAVARGDLVVTAGGQSLEREALLEVMAEVAEGVGPWRTVESGFTGTGPDLGSSSLPILDTPRIALFVDGSVSAYEAGEIWHDLDVRVGLEVVLVDVGRLASIDLAEFTHLILVNGATRRFEEREESAVRDWVRGGGVLVATKGSGVWACEELLANADEADPGPDPDAEPRAYADYEADRAVDRVAGTIFRATADTTHPLCYGLPAELSVFKNASATLPEGEDPYATPLRYTEAPLVAGYASDENVAAIAGTPAARVERLGRGTVVALADDPCFRGVWFGTRPLLLNAVFFGATVRRTGG